MQLVSINRFSGSRKWPIPGKVMIYFPLVATSLTMGVAAIVSPIKDNYQARSYITAKNAELEKLIQAKDLNSIKKYYLDALSSYLKSVSGKKTNQLSELALNPDAYVLSAAIDTLPDIAPLSKPEKLTILAQIANQLSQGLSNTQIKEQITSPQNLLSRIALGRTKIGLLTN